ncbi:MAG: Na+/H+ antiporter NhaA [Anaerolineales bacterium]|nr:Na+/H+ antiporter NhaA [Anaerolineales bacterium]MCB9126871.1 Na+/H+ antiporter NhaA [Ardenticatenales bacterium]MCB9172851.1 Na+/H+ antiporter NhaA [Ardenticatenales bacterium]
MVDRTAPPPLLITRLLKPMREFVDKSALSGIILFVATIAALIVANVPMLAARYNELLESYMSFSIGDFSLLKLSVLHFINDGLMAIFFLMVGLEIKRELIAGELSNRRSAMLPLVAAVLGAAIPATIYVTLNWGRAGIDGWGVPMATDIAFALGCMALLGKRTPFTLKIFLTAVAIVDDLIAVLVIALFYSKGINLTALAGAAVVLGILAYLNWRRVNWLTIYMILGLILWWLFLQSGVHATIAGVLLALTIPARYAMDEVSFLSRARNLLDRFEQSPVVEKSSYLINEHHQHVVTALEEAAEEVQAPLQKLEHQLHTPVMFGIMPIFAFANAGVALSLDGMQGDGLWVAVGIILGLCLGKPLGIFAGAWVAVKAGWAELPERVTWNHILGAGFLSGIGFTMSLFIAALGFGDGSDMAEAAKMGILAASLIAGSIGYFLLWRQAPTKAD